MSVKRHQEELQTPPLTPCCGSGSESGTDCCCCRSERSTSPPLILQHLGRLTAGMRRSRRWRTARCVLLIGTRLAARWQVDPVSLSLTHLEQFQMLLLLDSIREEGWRVSTFRLIQAEGTFERFHELVSGFQIVFCPRSQSHSWSGTRSDGSQIYTSSYCSSRTVTYNPTCGH